MHTEPTFRIIGFGNRLHGDDGFGSHLIDILKIERKKLSVEVFDAGVAGLNALTLFDTKTPIIVIDTIARHKAKAPLAWYDVEELIEYESLRGDHGIGLAYLFKALETLGSDRTAIHCLLIAADPPKMFNLDLSAEIKGFLAPAKQKILARINNVSRVSH